MYKILLLMFIYVFAGAAAFAGTVVQATESQTKNKIIISEYADVKPGRVKLHDIIKFRSSDEHVSIEDLEFADAPKAGEKIVFTNKAISQAVEHFIAKIKNPSEKAKIQAIQIVIPKEIIIQGTGWSASIERLYHYIPKNLSKLCLSECEIVVDELSLPKKKQNYNENTTFELAEFKSLPKGQFTVEATVFQDSVAIDKVWVQGRLRVLNNVPVAKRMILQSERLKESDFEIKKMDITMETDSSPAIETLAGAKLRRTLSANQIILNSAIEREKDVVYGQPVQVVVNKVGWQISLEGVARDSGSIGDRVKVFNPQSKKLLNGVLVSKGVVEIQ